MKGSSTRNRKPRDLQSSFGQCASLALENRSFCLLGEDRHPHHSQARTIQGISHSFLVLPLLVTLHKFLIIHVSQSTHTSRLSAHVRAYPCTP